MKSIFFTVLTGFMLCAHICTAQDTAAMQYIKNNAVKIDTAMDNLRDLESLKSIFADQRIIGMGEATHGTQEFQLEKFRMLKFLVTKMGFKLFGIEANFTECRQVNDYVLYGTGDAKKAVAGMIFWTWNTAEVVKMVEWMRQYNSDKPDNEKVKFYGFDMQFDGMAIQKISEKLKRLDSAYFNSHFAALKDIHLYTKTGYVAYSKQKRDSVLALIGQTKIYCTGHEQELKKLYSAEEVEYNERDLRLLEQCLDEDEASTTKKVSINEGVVRDKYMAENIEWILRHEGDDSKMLVWAHNAHVSKTGQYFDSMGQHLKKMYGQQYYVIGFDFNKGTFRARDITPAAKMELKSFNVAGAENGSTGQLFSTLNIPAFFVDMENPVKTNTVAKKFFTKKIRQRSAGAGFSTDHEKLFYIDVPLYDQYDGLVFINETTATTPPN